MSGQLRKAGCNSRNIYREKVTGARADRGELNRMLGKLAPGRHRATDSVIVGIRRAIAKAKAPA